MDCLLGGKLITFYSVIKESLLSLWRRQQTKTISPITSIKENQQINFLFHSWSEIGFASRIKKYYNSNLYEADSYLVIIIECFCEEWTNTWNWLRRELVAEYKGRASHSQSMKLIEGMSAASPTAASQIKLKFVNEFEEWMNKWNLIGVACRGKKGVGLLFLICCGLWAGHPPMLRNKRENKQTNQPSFSFSSINLFDWEEKWRDVIEEKKESEWIYGMKWIYWWN